MSVKLTMYCNNCGESGHVFRSCKDPIISCGIMLLRGVFEPLKLPIDPRQLSVLMVKRKDSMSYMEFIRGKYEISNLEYVKRLIKHMTIAEQQSISSSEFSVLWTKLWGNSRDTDSIEFDIAKDKFTSLPIQKLVKEVPSIFVEPEWGFPKGRRMRGESDVVCASREFFEETNIPANSYTILPNISFSETFVGTNDIKYKHVYFVALLQDSKLINLSQKLTPMQRREVSAVEWKTMMECKMITRPHYAERKKIIETLENQVKIYKS
jgi:8-oxo-dGTP pyrophosphatase MutT (NUDIX family)